MAVLTGHNRPVRISRDPLGVRPTQRGARRPVDPAATRTPGPVKMSTVAFRAPAPPPPASPIPEPFDDDAALVAALRRGDGRARVALVERFEPLVERLVAGALGIDSEIPDVVQDVFVAVLEGVHKLKDASALRSWIATLAVFTARGRIRRRRRWRWIRFVAPEEVPEVPVFEAAGRNARGGAGDLRRARQLSARRAAGVLAAVRLGDATDGGRGRLSACRWPPSSGAWRAPRSASWKPPRRILLCASV